MKISGSGQSIDFFPSNLKEGIQNKNIDLNFLILKFQIGNKEGSCACVRRDVLFL